MRLIVEVNAKNLRVRFQIKVKRNRATVVRVKRIFYDSFHSKAGCVVNNGDCEVFDAYSGYLFVGVYKVCVLELLCPWHCVGKSECSDSEWTVTARPPAPAAVAAPRRPSG